MPSLNKIHFGDLSQYFWCLLICSLLSAITASAQVKYAFSRDTVQIKGGETFSNFLKVSNSYDEPVVLTPVLKDFPKGLINLPDSLVLKAGETRVFPVKYIVDHQLIKSNIQEFKVNLVAGKPGIKVQAYARFITLLADVSGLIIGTEQDEVYLSQLSNQAQVVVRVANSGFVPLTFRLLLTGIPDGLEFTGQTMTLTLQPGAQQLLPFLATNKSANATVDFTVTIQALDASNHQLAAKMIRVLNVTSNRRMSSGGFQPGENLPNTVSLYYASLNRNSSYYQLQANGKFNTGDASILSYRLNADDYHQTGANGINVYNSYLDYESKKWGLKVGSIYDNLDFQLSGNGIKASAKLDDQSIVSLYGIQNNYYLYNQLNNSVSGGKIFALDYDLQKAGEIRKLTFVHSRDTVTGLIANQVSSKAEFKLGSDQKIGFEGGFSLENQIFDTTASKAGFSGGLSYTLYAGDYEFLGSGYYSSPYFTGIRRGVLLTDLRIIHKLADESSFSAHVNLQNNSPKYQDRLNNIYNLGVNKNSVNIYEIGYNTKAGEVNLNFTPYVMDQRLVSNGFSQLLPTRVNWKSSSVHFATNVGYNGITNSFSVLADYGYTYISTSNLSPAPYHSFKVTANYNMPILGVTGYAQLNPYYLSDALSSNGEGHYRLYSIGPNAHITTLKNTLSLQLGGMFNYYGFSSSTSYSANGSFRYLIKGNWAVTGDFQYYLNKQKLTSILYANNQNQLQSTMYSVERQSTNNRQVRLGIEKQFGRQANKGAKKLILAYYQDKNGNGKRDAGEDAVAGVLVKINNDAALTNSKGEVVFSEMKKEAYTVSITNTKGWSLDEPTDVFLDKNKKLEIGLVQTQALNGCIQPVASKYLNGRPELSGIHVSAVGANGRIHQTLTDDKGNFCFYLPRSKYTVYIETEGMPFSIENGKEEVTLEGKPVNRLTFLYKDQHRKVDVSRF